MRWGMPWWIGYGPPSEGIEVAEATGFDLVEISLDEPWPDGLSGPELRDKAQDAGVKLAFHAPWRTQALAHPRGTLARAAGTVAKECVDLALGADAEYVVFHVDARDFASYPRREIVEKGLTNARNTLKELVKAAGGGVDILVENTSTPTGTPAELAGFLEPLDDVGFCFDPGHAELARLAGTEAATPDPWVWADTLGDTLTLLHAMDQTMVDGRLVDHLVPGQGSADMAALVDAAVSKGCRTILIEAFYNAPDRTPAEPEDLAAGRKHLASFVGGE